MTELPMTKSRLSRICDLIFLIAVASLIALVLSLPAFPSGDGPLHTYYARIFRELASGPTSYSDYYALRRFVQPYCLHYLAFFFFEKWVSTLKAEELFVCIIILVNAFGFRFMAGRLGRNGSLVSLFMVPLLLDWLLGAGFMNNCLAIGLSFWAIGFWNLLPPAGSSAAFLGFLAVLLLLVLAHPVPLLVLILLMICDLALIVWGRRSLGRSAFFKGLGWRIASASLACVAVLIPASMAEKSKVSSVWRDFFPHRSVFLHLVEAKSLGYLSGSQPLILIYTLLLLALVPAVILLLWPNIREHYRSNTLSAAERQVIIMTAFLVFTVIMPRTVAGGSSFSERMWDMVWPLILATGAAAVISGRVYSRLALLGSLLIVLTGVITVPRLYALSLKQRMLSRIQLPRDQQGLLLEPFSTTLSRPDGASYPVFFWSGVRAFEASHAVLLNGPWMDERQIPVRAAIGGRPLAGAYLRAYTVDQPPILTREIMQRDPAALRALHSARFLLYSAPNEKSQDLADQMTQVLGPEAPTWSCKAAELYVLCLPVLGTR